MTVLPSPRRTTKALAAVNNRTKKEFGCPAPSDEPTPDPSQEGNARSALEDCNGILENSFSAVTTSVRVAPMANDRSNQPGL